MPLFIQTTGLEEYAPGGAARIKVLLIGGPGAGKTRWSSYFPKPIYADCERGLASVADRKVPYVNINTSGDMLDLLTMLKQECAQPAANRRFQTVVIDTLDAYQRKVKNEWMEKEKAQAFSGWEAWGFLNARMQMLMTRLLNLDMNVIVAVHYKDKTTKDADTGKESHELMLQLQGESADTAFNDFDLVGWMGTYWEAVDGERQQKRGLTFKATPEKPFLKDRLHVTPQWMEVTFDEQDYENLFQRIQDKLEDLDASAVIGEVPNADPTAVRPANVITPEAIGSGPVAGAADAMPKLTYQQMDKPSLQKLVRDRKITTTVDGNPIKNNTLKSELIDALEKADAEPTVPPTTPAQQPDPDPEPQPAPVDSAPAAAQPDPAPSPPEPPQLNTPTRQVDGVGQVDTNTGEIVDTTAPADPAVEAIKAELGGVVLSEQEVAPQPTSSSAQVETCEDCGKDLTGENPDFVKLSYIKYRKRLCENDYRARKAGK